MKLSANKNSRRIGCFFAFLWNACIVLVFGSVVLSFLAGIIAEIGREDPDLASVFAVNSGALLCVLPMGLIFLAVGIFLLWATARPYIAEFRVAAPEVTLSKESVRVGEEFQIVYRQHFKRAAEVEKVNITFYFRETATYQRGTDTYTVHHDITHLEHRIPGRHFPGGRYLEERLSLAIPREAMHTFQAHHNQLRWFVEVQVEVADWPDYDEQFEINVLPELADG